jgi:ribosome-binding protein aMBF1 (putative translation factor)
VRSELVTHDPPRWRVILDVIREPLTWHRRDFEDGELVNETPTLQTCSKEDLEDFHLIDADAAQRVLDAREKWGVLNSEILRKIELTESQIECIESFTRI